MGSLPSTSFYIAPLTTHCRPESHRAGGLTLFDKRSLQQHNSEWKDLQPTWTRNTKPSQPRRPSKKTASALSLPPSPCVAVMILFAHSHGSPPPSKERHGGVKRGGGIFYLTLICSVVSFGEMTCNLGGKGQLFGSLPLLRANLQAAGTLAPTSSLSLSLPKLQTISGWPRCCGFTHVDRGAKRGDTFTSPYPSPSRAH